MNSENGLPTENAAEPVSSSSSPQESPVDRRSFWKWLFAAIVFTISGFVVWGISVFSTFSPGTKRTGKISPEIIGKLEAGKPLHVPEIGSWLVRLNGDEQPTVLDDKCTHLGCRHRWNDDRGLFECPCHGSEFDIQGTVLRGPAKKNLPIHSIKPDGAGGYELIRKS